MRAARMTVWLMAAGALVAPGAAQVRTAVPSPRPTAPLSSRCIRPSAPPATAVRRGAVWVWVGVGGCVGQMAYSVGDMLSAEHRLISLPICAGPNVGDSVTLGDVLDSGKALFIGKSYTT